MRGPSRPATWASSASSASSGKPMRTTPRSPWTISSVPIGVAQAGVDGVGEPLAHGGGGDRVEQAGGKAHAGIPWVRRVRMAVETRWRAATAEQPRRAAMPS